MFQRHKTAVYNMLVVVTCFRQPITNENLTNSPPQLSMLYQYPTPALYTGQLLVDHLLALPQKSGPKIMG